MALETPDDTAIRFLAMDQHDKLASNLYEKAAAAFGKTSFAGDDRAFIVNFVNMVLEQIGSIQEIEHLLRKIVELNSKSCNCSKMKTGFDKLRL